MSAIVSFTLRFLIHFEHAVMLFCVCVGVCVLTCMSAVQRINSPEQFFKQIFSPQNCGNKGMKLLSLDDLLHIQYIGVPFDH